MPSTTTTPNMNLVVPVAGVETGPQYANDLVSCFSVIDQHDHSPGNGVQITTAGLNINADLSFGGNNATVLRSVRLSSQSAVIVAASDLDCLYVVGVDLYYNDGNGNNVRITQSGAVAGTPGSIASLASPASATYVSGSQTFVWQSAANTAANMDCGSVILREVAASANGVTLSSPTALSSSYSVTFPAALPAATHFMSIDASGNIGDSWVVDNSSLEVSSSTVQVKALGISAAKLAADSVTTVKILDANVTTSKIADANVTSAKMGTANYTVSTSCGNFSTTSASITQVTNLTATLTLGGRPVSIFLQPDGNGTNGASVNTPSTSGTGNVFFYKDGVEIARWTVIGAQNLPVSGFRFEDTAGSTGSHTYTCRVQADGSHALFVLYSTLVARDF